MAGLIESTLSFVVQIIVFCLLVVAILLKGRKKYRQHGIIMLSAVVLHIISIIAIMGPSFSAFIGPGSIDFADVWVMLALVHGLAGLVAALLGVWLVVSWRLKADMQNCFRKKRVMDVTFLLWTLAAILGIVLYLRLVGVI